MKFEESISPLTDQDTATILIVRNESYLESLQLLRDDAIKGKLRSIYYAVENPYLFKEFPEADTITYHPDFLHNPERFNYGEALLNTPRMRPHLIITEHTDNQRALRTGSMFGIHMAADTPLTDDNSLRPLDCTIPFTNPHDGLFSFAIAIDSETIEGSIRNLHDKLQKRVQYHLYANIRFAYMDGKRWTITQDQVLHALFD